MLYSKPLRILLLILSWGSLLFLKPASAKRFSQAAILVSLLLTVESMIAIPYKLWTIKGGLKRRLWGDLSFIFGPFFAGTLWIFQLTFGKFWKYILVNIVVDFLMAYPFTFLFEKAGLYRLKRLSKHRLFSLSLVFAAVIYGYQIFLEKQFSRNSEKS
ncbi:hypothetical protein [Peribacillus frigoritolerans]|uniref:hypothetical protein n=1 Tax=Peribacillus frigoritolerans TaxID=450367 RepID=UPI00105A4376|nr:hypothetical protein [Peribacillus frigoritolerans]TDL80316.1 hypothetical protein E2R53_09800 [Peribacillus frigoritolerans]